MAQRTIAMLIPEPVWDAAASLAPNIEEDRPDYRAIGQVTRSAVLRLALLHGVLALQREYNGDGPAPTEDTVHGSLPPSCSDDDGPANREATPDEPVRFHRTTVQLQPYLVEAAEALIPHVERDPVWGRPQRFNRSNVLNLALALGIEHLHREHDPDWAPGRLLAGTDLFPVWGRTPGDRTTGAE